MLLHDVCQACIAQGHGPYTPPQPHGILKSSGQSSVTTARHTLQREGGGGGGDLMVEGGGVRVR